MPCQSTQEFADALNAACKGSAPGDKPPVSLHIADAELLRQENASGGHGGVLLDLILNGHDGEGPRPRLLGIIEEALAMALLH